MARPYTDPVEILTAPVAAQSPFIPVDAKIVVGAVAPASPDPIHRAAARLRVPDERWRHPETHDVHWRLERRKAAQTATTSSPHRTRRGCQGGSVQP